VTRPSSARIFYLEVRHGTADRSDTSLEIDGGEAGGFGHSVRLVDAHAKAPLERVPEVRRRPAAPRDAYRMVAIVRPRRLLEQEAEHAAEIVHACRAMPSRVVPECRRTEPLEQGHRHPALEAGHDHLATTDVIERLPGQHDVARTDVGELTCDVSGHQVGELAEHHTFGRTGRAGGVGDRHEAIGVGRARRCRQRARARESCAGGRDIDKADRARHARGGWRAPPDQQLDRALRQQRHHLRRKALVGHDDSRLGMRQHVLQPKPTEMDVDGDLRHPEPHERQKDHEVVGMIREHDRNPVAGADTECREAARETVHPIAELAKRNHRAVEHAKRLRRIVARPAVQKLRDRFHRPTVAEASWASEKLHVSGELRIDSFP